MNKSWGKLGLISRASILVVRLRPTDIQVELCMRFAFRIWGPFWSLTFSGHMALWTTLLNPSCQGFLAGLTPVRTQFPQPDSTARLRRAGQPPWGGRQTKHTHHTTHTTATHRHAWLPFPQENKAYLLDATIFSHGLCSHVSSFSVCLLKAWFGLVWYCLSPFDSIEPELQDLKVMVSPSGDMCPFLLPVSFFSYPFLSLVLPLLFLPCFPFPHPLFFFYLFLPPSSSIPSG